MQLLHRRKEIRLVCARKWKKKKKEEITFIRLLSIIVEVFFQLFYKFMFNIHRGLEVRNGVSFTTYESQL